MFWSWTVVAAILLGVVSSAAMQTSRSLERWAGICTSSGPGAMAAADTAGPRSGNAPWLPAAPHPSLHCPICSLHHDLPGLAKQAGEGWVRVRLAFAPPRPAVGAVPIADGWLPAQPRGPPRRI